MRRRTDLDTLREDFANTSAEFAHVMLWNTRRRPKPRAREGERRSPSAPPPNLTRAVSRRLPAHRLPGVEHTTDHARVGLLRFAELPCLVDRLPGQAEVCDGRDVPGRNIPLALATMALDLAPLLRRVILVREPALRLGLDLQSVGLSPVGRLDQFIEGVLER